LARRPAVNAERPVAGYSSRNPGHINEGVTSRAQVEADPNVDYEGMLELFPKNYHEPYYKTYINEDFCELASDCGLTSIRTVNAFVAKVMVFDKQGVRDRLA